VTVTRRAAVELYLGRPKPRRFPDRNCADADMIAAVSSPNVMARQCFRLAPSLLGFGKASPQIEGARRHYEF
jgi:ribosomal protein S14